MDNRRRCPTVPTYPQACRMPSRQLPAAAVPGLVTRQHQPAPDLWSCRMDPSGGTGRRQGAASQPWALLKRTKRIGTSPYSGLLRIRSVRDAGIVTNAASSVLCLLCRFPHPECSGFLTEVLGLPLADPPLQVHEGEDERWSVLEGDRHFRMASHAIRSMADRSSSMAGLGE
jgi:hypothetical protein